MTGTYFWIEDRKGKASYTFWECLLRELYPSIILESKKNSSELVKAVNKLEDNDNKYVIMFDNSFDNLQSILELKQLKNTIERRKNTFLLDIICFEYILLGFRNLIGWIYAPEDEFRIKRSKAIDAREKLVASIDKETMNYKDIKEIIEYDERLKEHNIEQLAAKLLFDLTRNTGFEVTKGRIGDCWVKACCEWEARQEDDICGLDHRKLSLHEKMKSIYEESCLKEQFEAVGLGV